MATNPDLQIDLMALADIGAHPGKVALEIHRQLRKQYGEVPNRVPLEGIARSIGIVEIVDHETKAFEGTLVANGNKGIIALRKGMQLGRRRFTLGHEIFHFLSPWHRRQSQKFGCSRADMSRKRDRASDWDRVPIVEKMEIEANEFSNAILLPDPEFKSARERLGTEPSLTHVIDLATRFGVSREVMLRTYIKNSRKMLAGIISHRGKVTRVIPKPEFPYLGLKKDVPLPHDSNTIAFLKSAQPREISSFEDAMHTGWLESPGNVIELWEQTLGLSNGFAMTLLRAEIQEDDEDNDDRNWNRRSSGRFR